MALRTSKLFLGFGASALAISACADAIAAPRVPPPASPALIQQGPGDQYVIGPLDDLTIFVWRNQELGGKYQVRPDGRITTPLINDMPAAGKTSAMLAGDIKLALSKYLDNPIVSVIVNSFTGTFAQQVRIVGATEKPAAIPYRAGMSVLDAMIMVGGLSQYAAGNSAKLIRTDKASGKQKTIKLKLTNLLKRADMTANVTLQPGDVIMIPESMF